MNPMSPMISNPVEVLERQAQVISLQNDTINELTKLLMQHMALEDLDRLPYMERLRAAGALRNESPPGGR